MPLRVNEKKIVVDELRRIANEASSAVAADYHGCSVAELTKFREKMYTFVFYSNVLMLS